MDEDKNLNDSALVRMQDLIDNPTARVPVCLCLDVSGSMAGEPIDELNNGVCNFYEAIMDDETALYAAEICVVTFGGDVKNYADFATLEVQPDPPTFDAAGGTPLGEAVNLALDLLERRKEQYKENGVDYYQPWLVLMTDGTPNGSADELARAQQRVCDLVNDRKLSVFPIGIGRDADMLTLQDFSPKRRPMHLQGLKFNEFFEWLSKSVAKVSQSVVGDKVKLSGEGLEDWLEV